jgi:hypothetical protein
MKNFTNEDESEFENRQNFDKCLNELLRTTSPNVIAAATEEKFFLQSFSSDNENEALTSSSESSSLNENDETNLTSTTLATTNASPSIKASSLYIKNAHYTKTKNKHVKKQNNQYYSTL